MKYFRYTLDDLEKSSDRKLFSYITFFAGGGGSSYFGHPQITSGATEEGQTSDSGGAGDPYYGSIPFQAAEGQGPN